MLKFKLQQLSDSIVSMMNTDNQCYMLPQRWIQGYFCGHPKGNHQKRFRDDRTTVNHSFAIRAISAVLNTTSPNDVRQRRTDNWSTMKHADVQKKPQFPLRSRKSCVVKIKQKTPTDSSPSQNDSIFFTLKFQPNMSDIRLVLCSKKNSAH